jgi:hypothetical protein
MYHLATLVGSTGGASRKKSDPKNSVLTPEDAKQKTFKWHFLVSDKGVKNLEPILRLLNTYTYSSYLYVH